MHSWITSASALNLQPPRYSVSGCAHANIRKNLSQQRACNEKSWLQVLVFAHVFTENV